MVEPPRPPAAKPSAAPIDLRGTRRAERFRLASTIEIVVDGTPATLIDVSVIGAQVVSPSPLKPNQRVRISLNDDQASVRLRGSVAWASFEIQPKGGPRYRAGIQFVDPDQNAIEAFCDRHRQE